MSEKITDGFEEWFKSHEWWDENSRRDGIFSVWCVLWAQEYDKDDIPRILDVMIAEIKDEFGS